MKPTTLSLLLPLLLITSCTPQELMPENTAPVPSLPREPQSHKLALIKRIMALPPYLVHKESPKEFEKKLRQGNFYRNDDIGDSSLEVAGDGTCSKRIFYCAPNGTLHVDFITAHGDMCDSTRFRYDAATRKLIPEALTPDEEGI